MKRLLVFMLLAVLIISCSSKKLLSVRKISHNGVVNNIASQYDFSQKQYSTLNNSKNSSAKNLLEVEGRITPVKNNQDFLASKDKVESSVLTTNYSHKELPHFIQQEKINKSFLEKVPILKLKETPNKDSVEIITISGRVYRGVVVKSDYDGYFIKLSPDREIYLSNIEIKRLTVISSTSNIKSNEIPITSAPSQDYLESEKSSQEKKSSKWYNTGWLWVWLILYWPVFVVGLILRSSNKKSEKSSQEKKSSKWYNTGWLWVWLILLWPVFVAGLILRASNKESD